MLVGGHPFPPLHMAPHGQDVQGGDGGAQGLDVLHPGLLPGLPQGHGEQIPVPVGVAPRPGPHPVQVVVGHEHAGAVAVDHEAGGGQVGDFVLPGEDGVGKEAEVLQKHGLVPRLRLVPGLVGQNVIQVHVRHASDRSHSGRGCPHAPGAPPPPQ